MHVCESRRGRIKPLVILYFNLKISRISFLFFFKGEGMGVMVVYFCFRLTNNSPKTRFAFHLIDKLVLLYKFVPPILFILIFQQKNIIEGKIFSSFKLLWGTLLTILCLTLSKIGFKDLFLNVFMVFFQYERYRRNNHFVTLRK